MPPEIGSSTGQVTVADTSSADAQSQDGAPNAGAGTTDTGTPDGKPSLQAWATQKSQLAAAALTELGLGKNASPDEVQAAIRTLREQRTADQEFEDPMLAERAKELDRRAWRLADAEVGPEIAKQAREFYDEMRQTRDPSVFARAFNAAVMDAAQTLNGAQSQDGAQPAGQANMVPVPDLGTPGQSPASDTPPKASDFRGDPAGWIRARRQWARGRQTG